jgi:hypothetical protein
VIAEEALSRTIETYLAGSRNAVVLEDGAALFDLARAKYSLSGEHGKCLLHLWSDERNTVRRVIEAEEKKGSLQLTVQRMGQPRPSKLEICRNQDPRTPTSRKAARAAYQRHLQRMMERTFPEFRLIHMTTGANLEQSFGPVYARGLLRRGQSAFAILGVNAQETQSSVDASLTFAILWLDLCRKTHAAKLQVEGLKLFVPTGAANLVRARMAHLNQTAAKWRLYAVNELEDSLVELDCHDRGNVETRLVRCTDETAARERFAPAIAEVQQILLEAETAILSAGEIAFRHQGLEFARARWVPEPGSFRNRNEIVFGLGAEETTLTERTRDRFIRRVHEIAEVRHSEGPRDHPLFRLHPERWLERLALGNLHALDKRLDPTCCYSQMPAFSASDRAMIDVLAVTRDGRLAVLELKAEEDIHLPLQGLDYWSRVAWHHARGEFQRFGYFPSRELAPVAPLLVLVAPALHVHPATDRILHYLSPEIDWILLGIDERWRENLRVIFRKRSGTRADLSAA